MATKKTQTDKTNLILFRVPPKGGGHGLLSKIPAAFALSWQIANQ